MSGQELRRNTIVSESRYYISRSDNQIIRLPRSFKITHSRINRRIGVSDRLRADGGISTGDWTYDSRKMGLEYAHFGEATAEYRLSLNVLEGFFDYRFQPFYIVDTSENIRTKVAPISHDVQEQPGNNNQVSLNNQISLEMLDAFWESTFQEFFPVGGSAGSGAGTGATYSRLETSDEVTITNECEFPVKLIIELKAVDNLLNLIFENITTDSGFEFESQDYLAGTVLKFDGTTGIVTLQDIEKSSSLLSGGPLRLVPGPNVFRYTQEANGRVDFRAYWRERFAY